MTIQPTVLVVDDEPNVVHLCQRLLERTTYKVITANSSGQAIEILREQQVDLLIADIRMPGLDGLQLISQARNSLPDLAAILMTGYGNLETAISALQKGVDGLIIKPFSGVDFVQNADRALEARLHRKELLRLQALRPMLEVSETLFALRGHDLLPATLVNVAHKILLSDYTALFRQVEVKSYLAAHERNDTSWELIEALGSNSFPVDQPAARRLDFLPDSRLTEPILVSRTSNDPADWELFLIDSRQGSLLFVPIPANDQKLAILSSRASNRELYSQSDLEMLVVLARQSAVAFENARLYTDLAHSLEQLELSQTALLQAERLAAAGRLTASIAHEINNPLQALQNCLDLVSRRELEPEQREKYLELAVSELNRLMSTVERMLAFYRPIARDRKQVNLNDVILRAVALLQPQFDESAIVIHQQLDPLPLPIMAVASQIQQVLFNLFINSMEAMPDGGEIWITSRTVSEANSRSVEVMIEDSGPGIHGEHLDRLFEPLISSKPNGTGLGLAVSYGIVEAHGGSIKLLSGNHSGACFQIILPEE